MSAWKHTEAREQFQVMLQDIATKSEEPTRLTSKWALPFGSQTCSSNRYSRQAHAKTPRYWLNLSTNSRSLWTESSPSFRRVRVMYTERNHALCYTFSFQLVKGTLKKNHDAFENFPGTTTNSLRDFLTWAPSILQESSALLTQSCCWRFTPAASRRHVPRHFQILCVTLCRFKHLTL